VGVLGLGVGQQVEGEGVWDQLPSQFASGPVSVRGWVDVSHGWHLHVKV